MHFAEVVFALSASDGEFGPFKAYLTGIFALIA